MPTQKLVTSLPPAPGGQIGQRVSPLDTTVFEPELGGSIDDIRKEVDDAYADMRSFHNLEPDECMRLAGGHSARLSELRVRIMRIEDWKREWKNVRVREIEPTLEELKNQYLIASRLHAVRQLDWEMESGQHS